MRTVHGHGLFVDAVVTADLPLPERGHGLPSAVARTRTQTAAVAGTDNREDILADTSLLNGGYFATSLQTKFLTWVRGPACPAKRQMTMTFASASVSCHSGEH